MALDKVIDSAQLDADLTAVADAIRTKGGTTEQLSFPDGFVSAVEGIQAGGGDDVARSIVDRTITEYSDSNVATIGTRAFNGCNALKSVNIPNATIINARAFESCQALETVNAPKATTIKEYAFSNCKKLVSFDFSNVVTTGMRGFESTGIKEAYMPKVTELYEGFFRSSPIEKVYLPELVKFVGGDAVFFGCNKLTEVYAPKLQSVGYASFHNCTSLQFLDLPSCTAIGGTSGGTNCLPQNIKTLILRSETMCTLGAAYTFLASCAIYVPSALLDSYKAATNWSAYADNFVAIEGSEYE